MISTRLGKFQTPLLLLFSTGALLATLHTPCETSANTVLLSRSTLLLSAKLGSVRPCFGNLKLVLDSILFSMYSMIREDLNKVIHYLSPHPLVPLVENYC